VTLRATLWAALLQSVVAALEKYVGVMGCHPLPETMSLEDYVRLALAVGGFVAREAIATACGLAGIRAQPAADASLYLDWLLRAPLRAPRPSGWPKPLETRGPS